MWDEFWAWMYSHYIFHTIVILAIVLILFRGWFRRIFRWIKRIKLGPGGIELETAEPGVDPNTPCPYKKSRDESFGVIRETETRVNEVEKKVDSLAEAVQKAIAIVEEMSIDQQKSLFYDKDQPDEDRLAGGLRYLYKGGNGGTKPNVVAFVEEHPELYKGFVKSKPELRLK